MSRHGEKVLETILVFNTNTLKNVKRVTSMIRFLLFLTHNNKASVSGAPGLPSAGVAAGSPRTPTPLSIGLASVISFRAYVHIWLPSVHLCPVMRLLPGEASPVEKPSILPCPTRASLHPEHSPHGRMYHSGKLGAATVTTVFHTRKSIGTSKHLICLLSCPC